MFSFPHLLIVLLIVLLVFGAGKLPKVMGDVGKGIRNLREGLKAEEDPLENKAKADEQKVITDVKNKL